LVVGGKFLVNSAHHSMPQNCGGPRLSVTFNEFRSIYVGICCSSSITYQMTLCTPLKVRHAASFAEVLILSFGRRNFMALSSPWRRNVRVFDNNVLLDRRFLGARVFYASQLEAYATGHVYYENIINIGVLQQHIAKKKEEIKEEEEKRPRPSSSPQGRHEYNAVYRSNCHPNKIYTHSQREYYGNGVSLTYRTTTTSAAAAAAAAAAATNKHNHINSN
jgi:hypothetical protein